MKALLINPETQSIDEITVDNLEQIKQRIGFDTVIADEIGPQGEHLFFDEECFLRGSSGRFQIDNIVPVSGLGIIINATDDGQTLADVVADVDSIKQRIKYL